MDEEKTVQEQDENQEQETPKGRRRGRKPMTQKQKDAMARGRAEKKKQAENMKPEVYVQYQDGEGDVAAIIAAAREADAHHRYEGVYQAGGTRRLFCH